LKKISIIFFLFVSAFNYAQRDTSKYDRLEEIIDNDKRYALHNNYLSVGFGLSASNVRDREQSTLGIDYVFHIKREHFQVGFLMSGDRFLSNNNLQAHACYGYRIENEKHNIAFFGGPSFNTGVLPPKYNETDTIPARFYEAIGLYLSASYIHKLTYDIGIGIEGIFEVNSTQVFGGIKASIFFSGAYRGKSKIYNKHVKRKQKR
jgi:hypothetical protein